MAIEKSKGELVSALSRARNTITKARAESRVVTKRAINSSAVVGAGYLTGLVRNKMGEGTARKVFLPGTQVEGDLAVGVALTILGVAGIGDEYADTVCSAGAGVLAAYAGLAAIDSYTE